MSDTPHLDRIVRATGTPGVLAALATGLAPTDLQTLLLEVFRRRAAGVTPARLLARYRADRFTAPSGLAALELARLEVLVLELLAAHGFEGLALSPVCPLGTNSAVATVDQNKVVTTVRNTEVVADTSNVLALECAARRQELLRAAPRSREPVRLGAVHRVVRAQVFSGPGMVPHFALLALCTAGRDEGSFRFETATLAGQLAVLLDVLERAGALGHPVRSVRVLLTDLTGGRHRAALRALVLDPLAAARTEVSFGFDDARTAGRGYYVGACFEIRASTSSGAEFSLADGGFTTWTADLVGNAKERLLISGLGLELLCGLFR